MPHLILSLHPYLHSTVVLLKRVTFRAVCIGQSHLHSTVVLLKRCQLLSYSNPLTYLHSTVVLLKLVWPARSCCSSSQFTFYCSSIKTLPFCYLQYFIFLFTFYCSSIKTRTTYFIIYMSPVFTFYCSSIKTYYISSILCR